MPLDPLSALSVAASAIQFIDFSSKIVSKRRHIYKSADGILREDAEVENVVTQLQALTSKLEDLTPTSGVRLDPDQLRLQQICKECSKVSKDLILFLGQLKVSTGTAHRGWDSLRTALKSAWSKEKVDAMVKRLEVLRAELDTHVLISMRQVYFYCEYPCLI
jgi:hypothetical protein